MCARREPDAMRWLVSCLMALLMAIAVPSAAAVLDCSRTGCAACSAAAAEDCSSPAAVCKRICCAAVLPSLPGDSEISRPPLPARAPALALHPFSARPAVPPPRPARERTAIHFQLELES